MAWPTSNDYFEAVQSPPLCFGDDELRGGEPARDANGLPILYSGNFASVFQLRCPAQSKSYAVKCFVRRSARRQERYRLISDHLERAALPFTVPFRYLEEGIRVGGAWYPMVMMDWIEGQPLNEFVRGHLAQPQLLLRLCEMWVKVAQRLREAQVTHADLQHGNVLLVPGADEARLSLKLVDYDGMFVPAVADIPSGELGLRHFQHPWRQRDKLYSSEVDRFSHLVIYTALRALAPGGAAAWPRFDNGENLLFCAADFQRPAESRLLHELWRHESVPVRALTGHLVLATMQPLNMVPLLDDIVKDDVVRSLTVSELRSVEEVLAGLRTERNGPAQAPANGKAPVPSESPGALATGLPSPEQALDVQLIPVPASIRHLDVPTPTEGKKPIEPVTIPAFVNLPQSLAGRIAAAIAAASAIGLSLLCLIGVLATTVWWLKPSGDRLALPSDRPRDLPKVEPPLIRDGMIVLSFEQGKISYEGRLEKTDPLLNDPLRPAARKHVKMFAFPGQAGKTYQIDLESKDFDAYLYLKDSAGKTLKADDDSGGNLNSRIIHKVTQAGAYRIVATSLGDGKTRAFRLTIGPGIEGPPPAAPPWAKDGPPWGPPKMDNPMLGQKMDFQENQNLPEGRFGDWSIWWSTKSACLLINHKARNTIELTGYSIGWICHREAGGASYVLHPSGGSPSTQAIFGVEKYLQREPAQIEIASGNYRVGNWRAQVANDKIEFELTVPKINSKGHVVIKPDSGEFTYNTKTIAPDQPPMKRKDPALDAKPVPPPKSNIPVLLTLKEGKATYEGQLARSDHQVDGGKYFKAFRFNGEANKSYQIDLHSKAFDAYLYLRDAIGKTLDKNDAVGPKTRDSRIVYKVTKAGPYVIYATSAGDGETGAFVLTVAETAAIQAGAKLKKE